jgi:tRNA(Arg) A34 adenosine deaminase TadA
MAWGPLSITLPRWIERTVDERLICLTQDERVRVAIALARDNVLNDTGGPFGAAIFDRLTGRVVGVGANLVIEATNSTAHAEILAIGVAEARLRSWTLGAPGHSYELVTSCDPCAMCLGAALWSGVSRIVAAADRVDASALGFDEGPVFADSFRYLEQRGIEIVRGVLRSEAREVFDLYRGRGGTIYNG